MEIEANSIYVNLNPLNRYNGRMKQLAMTLTLALALAGCASEQPDISLSASGAATAPAEEQVRKDAPEFELTDVAGGAMKSSDIKGKVAIVDFWATWCAPCIQEIPNYNELHATHGGNGVQMLGITILSGALEDITPKVTEFEMNYPVLVGDDEVLDNFGGSIGFPTTYVVDKNWKIYKKYLGFTANKREHIEQDIQKLLAE
jgi:thiol-disulfide isomerase/thioredoxin